MATYSDKIKNLQKLTHDLLVELDSEELINVGRGSSVLELINNAHSSLSHAIDIITQIEKLVNTLPPEEIAITPPALVANIPAQPVTVDAPVVDTPKTTGKKGK